MLMRRTDDMEKDVKSFKAAGRVVDVSAREN